MGFQLMQRAAASAALLLAVAAPVVSAQAIVRGILYDDANGTAVRGTVMLVDPSTSAPIAHVVSDSLGQFSLRVNHGTYQIAAVRSGYSSVLSAPIALISGEQLTIRVPIATSGDPHHEIGVVEHTRPAAEQRQVAAKTRQGLDMDGFETRRRIGIGLQYDRSDIERSSFHTLGEFLQNVPGFRVSDPGSTSTLSFMRSTGLGSADPTTGRATTCPIGWFVDGHRMNLPGMNDLVTDGLGTMDLNDIEMIEVFRGISEMPSEYAAPDLRCGAVSVWTRRGGQ
jgi:hypothetical protein